MVNTRVSSAAGALLTAVGFEGWAVASELKLDEVVVTAQRRSEGLQQVPMALTALDAETLRRGGLVSVDTIAVRTPGFSMGRFNVGEPQMYIRGLGSNSDSAGGDPTVGIFLDEIYIGRVSGATVDLHDLERVEVLRGPQGTLYGRNTAGGAINIVPKLPSAEVERSVEVDLGNFELLAARGVLNQPTGDASAIRLSVSHRSRAGYSESIPSGRDLDDENTTSARLQWQWATSSISILRVALDATQDDQAGNARVPGPVFTDQTGTNALATAALLRIWPLGSDPRRSYSLPESFQRRDVLGASVRWENERSWGTWTMLGGWREVKLSWFEDLDGLKPFGNPPLPGAPASTLGWVLSNADRAREEARQHSLELRAVSTDGAALRWIVGAYAFSEDVVRAEQFVTRFSLLPAAGGDVTFSQDADNRSGALYGQVSAAVGDAWTVTGGARWTRDRKQILQRAVNNDPLDPVPGLPLFPGQPYVVNGTDTWDSLTGRVSLEYRPAANRLLYASASRGFKAGVFPSQNNVVQNVGTATAPERILSYEIGAKTDWLDQRLRVNAAAYVTNAQDLQLSRLDPQLRLVTFTEDARIKGLELELAAVVLTGLEVGAIATLMDARIDGGANDGNRLQRSPRQKFGGYAQKSWVLGSGDLSARFDYHWTDRFFTDVPNNRTQLVSSYGLLDVRVGYRWSKPNVELAVWGRNLGDELYAVHTISFLGNGFSLYGAPRTFGVSLQWGQSP